jgi:excisionase family DNA binding protein
VPTDSVDLTLAEAAQILGVTSSTLRAQDQKGRLRTHKRGRDRFVSLAEVERYAREVQQRPLNPSSPERTALGPLATILADRWEATLRAVELLADSGSPTDLEMELVRLAKRCETRLARLRAAVAITNARANGDEFVDGPGPANRVSVEKRLDG